MCLLNCERIFGLGWLPGISTCIATSMSLPCDASPAASSGTCSPRALCMA